MSDKTGSQPPEEALIEVVIPKENAVFWMDDRGRWHNRHGRFEHKRIIDHFNQAIRWDEDGFFVTQVRGNIREKVYFPYAETPLFVLQVVPSDPIRLVLNTSQTIPLDANELFSKADQLYQRMGRQVVKFTDRALMALSTYLEETPSGLAIQVNGQHLPIPEEG